MRLSIINLAALAALLSVLFMFSPYLALAQGDAVGQTPSPGAKQQNLGFFDPLGGKDFTQIIANILTWLLRLASILVPIIIVIGAFQMLLSQGKPDSITTGKKTILYAVIGYIIILISKGIVSIVENILK